MRNVIGYFVVPYMILHKNMHVHTYMHTAIVDLPQQGPRDATICQQSYDMS